MESGIKIAILPLNISWNACEANLMAVAEKLPGLSSDTDILVLPELFSTGFIKDKKILQNTVGKSSVMTLATVRLWSRHLNMAIAGSYLSHIGSRIVNRGFFIEPSGEETFYDKHHLFCLSPESELYSNGTEQPPVIRFRGWNISLAVCYDLRFPVWCRNKNQKYDIMIVPANWPAAREYAWRHLLIARAIENQAIVVGANRSGHDEYGNYDGLSFIFDPLGKPLSGSMQANDDFVYAEYSRQMIDKIRSALPVGRDADNYEIIR